MAGGERSLYRERAVVCARLQICRAPLSSQRIWCCVWQESGLRHSATKDRQNFSGDPAFAPGNTQTQGALPVVGMETGCARAASWRVEPVMLFGP